jgi:predicted metal-dependent hydrolase
MPILNDDEFGKITIRRSARASQVRLRVGPDGTLRASLPLYAPTFLVKRLVASSRTQLRELLSQSAPSTPFEPGMRIGKSHSLVVQTGEPLQVQRHGQQIVATIPESNELHDPTVVTAIREVVQKALRIEAKSYLPKRLKYLAEAHGFSYNTVRFSHASGRWGSCTSQGTISLNIALMKLPFELIDYVLIHELSHTKHMNHSAAFWEEVAEADPNYVQNRKALKQESPTI